MIKELDGGIKGVFKRALKYGNLQYKIPCAIFDKMGYSNHELQDLEVRNRVARYLEKHYSSFLNNYNYQQRDECGDSNKVWICWLQGIDNAPDIVRACYNSIKKWLPNSQIYILNQSNLLEYVNLPDYIIDKWKKGIISNTLFSDFIRLSVLEKFGGIWLDATVYFTGPLPDYILRSDFFMYRCNIYDITKFGESWFIKANAHNFIIEQTLKLLCEYWRKENKIRDYFQMFIFMRMVINKHPNLVENMINIPNTIPHILQEYLNNDFDLDIYRDICSISNIHKLTYKGLENKKNTFADFIINANCEEK